MIRIDYDSVAYLESTLKGLGESTSSDVPSAREYRRLFVVLPVFSSDGLMYTAVHSTAQTVETATQTWIADLGKAMANGADCTNVAIKAARAADAASVELLNGRYQPADIEAGYSTAGDAARAALEDPVAATDFAQVFDALGMIGNWISPAWWLGGFADWAIDRLAGEGVHDPYALVGQTLAGDWTKVSFASDALTHLSSYFTTVAKHLEKTWDVVDPDWDGKTADAAGNALEATAKSLEAVAHSLSEVAKEYNAVAVGVYQTADVITGLLRELTDLLIAAAVAAIAGTALIETAIGAIAGYAAAAAFIIKAIAVIAEISKWLSAGMQLAELFAGQCALWLGTAPGVKPVAISSPSF